MSNSYSNSRDDDDNQPDTLVTVIYDMFKHVQCKLFLFTFIIFVFLSSDTFTTRVLSKFDGAVVGKYPSSWGVILQGIFLVIAIIIIDIFTRQGII
jgi:hypothetical protein